jgi:transposase
LRPGDVVVLDNLAAHKQPTSGRPSSRPARLFGFSRPTGPDFNPIELAIAKLKTFLRAARPRSFEQVCELVATALGFFTSDECANDARHCGYRVATS